MANEKLTKKQHPEETAPKETKKAAPKKTAAKKAEPKAEPQKAAAPTGEKHLRPVITLQYQGIDVKTEDLVSAAISQFKAAHSRIPVVTLDLYLKPEERSAYYVINGDFSGKLTY